MRGELEHLPAGRRYAIFATIPWYSDCYLLLLTTVYNYIIGAIDNPRTLGYRIDGAEEDLRAWVS
jgi:hypothetical protein